MKVITWIALLLTVIGAINWGLWGAFQIDLVALLFKGPSSVISRVIYTIVGLAGIWSISLFKWVGCCTSGKDSCDTNKNSCDTNKKNHSK